MGAWDNIKSFFKRIFGKNEELLLRDVNPRYEEQEVVESNKTDNLKQKEFNERIQVKDLQANDLQLTGIDYSIDQYLASILDASKKQPNVSFYSALTSLSGFDANEKMSRMKENRLLNVIKNIRGVEHREQRAGSYNGVAFHHVAKKGFQPAQYRLYLNCKPENLSDMTYALINEMNDMDSYYFKFNSYDQNMNRQRSEQMVFYAKDDVQLSQLVSKIEKVKNKSPELFEGVENTNPFMKTYNGYIGYAPEVESNEYIGLDNKIHSVSKSYNSFVSESLEESFVDSIRKVVAGDYNLSKKIGGRYFANSKPYIDNCLEDIYSNDRLKMLMISNMKNDLQILSGKNKILNIKGIEPRTASQDIGYAR